MDLFFIQADTAGVAKAATPKCKTYGKCLSGGGVIPIPPVSLFVAAVYFFLKGWLHK